MILQSKYAQDENGNKFAPITTPNAVRWSNGDNLDDKLAEKQAVIDSSNKLPASNVSGLANVATSGSYNDLSNKPTIPDAQIQSDWNQSSSSAIDYIKNKPTIPTVNNATLTIQKNGTQVATFTANASSNVTANITVPTGDLASVNKDGTSSTKYLRGDGTWQTFPTIPTVPTNVSAFTNDAGYITSADIAGKEDKMSIVVQTGYPTTLSPAINTLTKVIMQSSLTVTLPTISTNTDKVQSLVLHLSTASGYTPNLIISGSGTSIEYPPDFTIESGTSYEINCMWIGNATWVVASQQIQDFGA